MGNAKNRFYVSLFQQKYCCAKFIKRSKYTWVNSAFIMAYYNGMVLQMRKKHTYADYENVDMKYQFVI